MIIDLIIAVFIGSVVQSWDVFVWLLFLSVLLGRSDRPWSSGLLKLALLAMGISFLMALFGGRGDCDCDL